MTLREPPRLLPDLWKWTLASGVLAVILGVCVLVWPAFRSWSRPSCSASTC